MLRRAEPKKKKKVDPRREMMMKERLKKKLKRLEKVPPELIPIEDFITPAKCFDETRYNNTVSTLILRVLVQSVHVWEYDLLQIKVCSAHQDCVYLIKNAVN